MRLTARAVTSAIVVLVTASIAQAQSSSPTVSIPRLINVSGVLPQADGRPIGNAETITLAIYAEETGGTPIWQETQTVQPDGAGKYSVLLGATLTDGVPLEVFASGEARWLGMTWASGGGSQARRSRLTFVPYAVHAGDADALGGKPASAFALVSPNDGTNSISSSPSDPVTPRPVLPGATNQLAKYVNSTDLTPSTLFESGGKVGIGTTSPLDTMYVEFSNGTGSFTGYAVRNLSNTATSYSGMLFYDHNGALGQFQGFNNSTHEYRINNVAKNGGGGSNGTMNFMIGGSSRLFISTFGGVGFGTTSPDAPLDLVVQSGGSDTAVLSTTYGMGANNGFMARAALGSPASPIASFQNMTFGTFSGAGYDGTSFGAPHTTAIEFRAAQNWSPNGHGSAIQFWTTPVGSTTPVQQVKIDHDGQVGIGTTNPLDTLHVVGDIRVGAGTTGCVKDADATVIAGTCSSDMRLKKEITAFGPTLQTLTALQPVHYFWRSDEFPARHLGTKRTYGLIAQDVEQVLPDLVVTGDDGYKAVDYSKLPLLTIQAVKELKTENDALKARVTELEQLKERVAELEKRLAELAAARR